jgi:hypothetical protein
MLRRSVLLTVAMALAAQAGAARAHDDDFVEDWGYVDAPDGEPDVDVGEPDGAITFETFEDNLAPHGEWMTVSGYGRVWRPLAVGTDWRPYYDGTWQWTDEGWLWVSSEPWGWATYHYGRWAYDGRFGWIWIPGYQWAPAWVSWRIGIDYIGWAPLGPGLSVYVTNYPVLYDHWVFVPCHRFVGVSVRSVAWVGHARVGRIWPRTHPAPPRAVVLGSPAPSWGGPARPFIERRGGRPVNPVRVQPVPSPRAIATVPRGGGVVPVFRPEARVGRRDAPARAPSGAVAAPSRPGAGPSVAAPRGAGAAPPSSALGAAPSPGPGAIASPWSERNDRGAAAPQRRPAPSRGSVAPPRGGAPGGLVAPPARAAPDRGAVAAPPGAPGRALGAPPARATPGGGAVAPPRPVPNRSVSPAPGAGAARSAFAHPPPQRSFAPAAPQRSLAPRAAPGRAAPGPGGAPGR